MRRVGLLGILIVVLLLLNAAHATIWYVHPDSTLNSIQAGIGLCSTGDTVLVGPGIYIENINFNGMAITVTSEYGPDTTIIDGGSPVNPDSASVVTFISGEDTTSVLEGFTLTNGTGTIVPPDPNAGGGIYCENHSSPTITGNKITGNTATYGAGMTCYLSCSPIITGNTITANIADSSGGGIECYGNSFAYIANNAITGNVARWGGGIIVQNVSSPAIIGNTITSNSANLHGGGIALYDLSSPTIEDNLISNNTASGYGGGIECWGNCSPVIKHCVIDSNAAGNRGGAMRIGEYSSPAIDSCTIAENTVEGIWCHNGSNPSINYCNIYGHTGNAVWNTDQNLTVIAEYCWWGDSTGPFHPIANPTGLGNSVSDYVDFIPWLKDSVEGIGIEELESTTPLLLSLQVSPNPFRDKASITFSMEHNMETVTFTIYDATGRAVKEFNNPANNLVFWNGTDNANRKLPSGVYFLKLEAGNYSATKKLLMIR